MSGFYINIIIFFSKFKRNLFFLPLGLTLLLLASCDLKKQEQNDASPIESQVLMTLDTLLGACWNKKEITKLEMVMTEDASRRVNNITVANNRKEVAANIAVFISGFPDLNITMSNLHISNKYASYNWIFSGTNTGIFGEFPATGKKVKISGMSKVTFNEEGKIVLEDVSYNELDLLQQLGYSLDPPILE